MKHHVTRRSSFALPLLGAVQLAGGQLLPGVPVTRGLDRPYRDDLMSSRGTLPV